MNTIQAFKTPLSPLNLSVFAAHNNDRCCCCPRLSGTIAAVQRETRSRMRGVSRIVW